MNESPTFMTNISINMLVVRTDVRFEGGRERGLSGLGSGTRDNRPGLSRKVGKARINE